MYEPSPEELGRDGEPGGVHYHPPGVKANPAIATPIVCRECLFGQDRNRRRDPLPATEESGFEVCKEHSHLA